MSGLYAVPAGEEFATAFARGFWARWGEADAGADPLAPARIEVIANTPRARRRFEEALADTTRQSALLPRLSVVTDLGADPLAPVGPRAIPPLRRRLRLIRLVERYLEGTEGKAVAAAAPALADSLAALLDELDEAGLDARALDGLEAGDQPQHWERTLRFVDLVRQRWPAIRRETEAGAPDPKARQRAAIEARIAAWEAMPPTQPVIAAGSTGSVASTRMLLTAIARLPVGHVVLPGFDPGMPRDIWAPIAAGAAPEHPQAPFAALLAALGAEPGDVAPWDLAEPPHPARHRLLTETLRPAPVTDAWRAAAPALARDSEAALAGLTLIEAAHGREEAGAIALAIREALEEPETRIALITPDASLARRVSAELARYEVLADDSLGRPLAEAPPAVFLRLIAAVASEPADPVTLAGLLQHPLMRAGLGRGPHLRLARRYERQVLRKGPGPGLPGRLPPWPEAPEAARPWLAGIEHALTPFAAQLSAGAPLSRLLEAHLAAAEALSHEPDQPPALWEADAGAATALCVETLARAAPAHGEAPVAAYPALLASVLEGETLRPDPAAPHPRVAILGPREARTHPADLVILGGLSDGVWPALPAADPWLSREQRRPLGLAPPESRIGLTAHDFLHAAARPRVMLSRSARRDGTPTVASRWLARLTGLLEGLETPALAAMRARGVRLLATARALAQPPDSVPHAPRPRPAPPAAARPRDLSVTDIGRLIADPYAVYARHVLALRELEPLGRPPAAAERGEALHAVLERFGTATAAALPEPPEAQALLDHLADAVLAKMAPWPDLRRLWRARIGRLSAWFLEGEAERRAQLTRLATECDGTLQLAAPSGPVTIRARADRIDLHTDGRAAIYDYKSGRPPSKADIAKGRHLQIPIEAAMLTHGAFAGIGARSVAEAAYLGLTGTSGAGGAVLALDAAAMADPDGLLARVAQLIEHFATDGAFVARGRPSFLDFDGDYDHLSRRAEWEERE